MIRVEIDCMNIPQWAATIEGNAFQAYVCSQLKDAGVPIVGGPILPRVDFTKGSLDTWDDYETGKKIYVWKPKG